MKFKLLLVTAVAITSCTSPGQQKVTPVKNDDSLVDQPSHASTLTVGDFTPVGDSIQLPPFEIEIQLSEKAEMEIGIKKESIIVAAYLSGIPKDTTKYESDGSYPVGGGKIELTASRVATFSELRVAKKVYETLANKDISVLINVFSGRKSFKNNILNCDILEKPVSQVKNQKFILKGKLIGE